MKTIVVSVFVLCFYVSNAQLTWTNVDSLYQPLPPSVHVFFTSQKIDTSPFRAFYVSADLKEKKLDFTTDTSENRRFTPSQFYERNHDALVVVNGTFFSFETNQNLNLVVKKGKLIAYNQHFAPARGRDTLTYWHLLPSAIGISKKREAAVAWTYTDSSRKKPYADQWWSAPVRDSDKLESLSQVVNRTSLVNGHRRGLTRSLKKWKVETAIGGGPVLLQNGETKITNNEERKFAGKAINDKHPRTAMGYTADNKLIILVVEGRNPNAAGATLTQEAEILKALGCVEALNLDGGGSSCLLVNGKETIKPSDKEGQRAVPAVFIIRQK